MGKGYNNFMCKKPFHPASRDNIKRVWMAEQRNEDHKKKEEEMRVQYEKEQDLYNNRLMVSTESKDKLSLNFMYEAPPGAKKERQREDDEPEYKFEWQRHAPRESFAKNNMEIRDQPFGIAVRNVRCIKCHKWGHLNTDRECPLYNHGSSLVGGSSKVNPEELIKAMQEDGLALKKSIVGQKIDPQDLNQVMISNEEDPEMVFLKSLSNKQKRKLLKKLSKLSGPLNSDSSKTKKHKHKKHKKEKRKYSSESESDDRKNKDKHRDGHKSSKNKNKSIRTLRLDEDYKHRHRDEKRDKKRSRSRSSDRDGYGKSHDRDHKRRRRD